MSARSEVWSSVREQMRMNIHGVISEPAGGVRSDWNPGGEVRWRELQDLLDRLARAHKIDDRIELEDTVDAATMIYRHGPGALPKADIEQLLECIPKVTKGLRRENDTRIASVLLNRENRLIEGRTWWSKQRGVSQRRIEGILESGLVFNSAPLDRRQIRRLGLFDGWDSSYERAVAINLRLEQIRGDLSNLERCLRQLPRGRKGDRKFHGVVAVLRQRWERLSGKKVSQTKFIESVVAFIDPNLDVARKLRSAMRHRLKGIAKS